MRFHFCRKESSSILNASWAKPASESPKILVISKTRQESRRTSPTFEWSVDLGVMTTTLFQFNKFITLWKTFKLRERVIGLLVYLLNQKAWASLRHTSVTSTHTFAKASLGQKAVTLPKNVTECRFLANQGFFRRIDAFLAEWVTGEVTLTHQNNEWLRE